MKRTLFLFIFLISLACTEMYAWGRLAHRVIAEIAEQNLTDEAQRKVTKLLDNYPMAYWAFWADEIRSDTTDRWDQALTWHFINIPSNLERADFEQAVFNFHQANVFSVIEKLTAVLKDKNASTDEKSEALYFLIHMVGDLHNPMHVGREEDRGGNLIRVMWFREERNLHWVWDVGVVDDSYSYTEYANILNGVLTKQQRAEMKQGAPIDWLWEVYQFTNEIYDYVQDGDRLSFAYNYKYKSVVELLFQLAGVRLAHILNECF